jgi:hypothetical protein
MIPFYRLMSLPRHLHRTFGATVKRWAWLIFCAYLLLSGTAISGTPIDQDPNGFFGIQWGTALANRNDLKEIDASNTLHIYTLKDGEPHVEGILMESVKLYGVEDQYARALFRYKGETTHKSLLQYLENRFGKSGPSHGTMMRGLNQQYTWRGPETEITITYHGFRERGFLTAESRVLAPRFLDVHSDHSF